MARKTKAQLEATIADMLATNALQLDRLCGEELLRMRVCELEGMLNDAIDERVAAEERATAAEKALELKAASVGMVR